MPELLNTRAASEALDLPQLEVVRRIRKGQIVATKWGWNWAIEASEIEKVRDAEWYRQYQRRRATSAV